MRIATISILATTLVFAILAIGMSEDASARIKCKGQFQVIKGQGLISTPYCQAEYLAAVARSYGRKVTGRQLRQNINLYAEVCIHIGHDTRISNLCAQYRDRGRRRKCWFC